MKIASIISFILLISSSSYAQVELDKTKSTLVGKNNVLLENFPETILDHFNINFYNYFMGADEGGNNAKGTFNSASIEAELNGLDNKLAQEITNEAYTYFIEKWKERGIIVKCPTAAEMEATKQFAKDKGKGKAEIVNPGIYQGGNAYAKYITVIPTNTAQIKKEYFGNFVYGNAQNFPPDFKGNVSNVNFHFDLNFISFRNGFGTQAAIKGKVGLKSTAGGSIVLWAKAKNLAAAYYTDGVGGSDFYENDENSKLFAATKEGSRSSSTKWTIKIDAEKYKALALEMIKKSLDGQFAAYDVDLAKEKK